MGKRQYQLQIESEFKEWYETEWLIDREAYEGWPIFDMLTDEERKILKNTLAFTGFRFRKAFSEFKKQLFS